MEKEVVLSGIRPTGYLHLGNYFGAMQNYVKMQNDYNCYFFVANWHSLTTHPDTSEMRHHVYRVLAENIACGLDYNKVTLYVQSEIPEIAELYYILNTLAYKGELEKTTTFKDKVRTQPDNVNAGLLTYPVLQAADILIHRAVKVPVGKDQEQNLEMARNFASRFNHRYQEVLPLPYAFNYNQELIKIQGLDGLGKMSKSENQLSTIFLQDDPETIYKKIMKAKTDQGPATPQEPMPPYIENIFLLLKLMSSTDTYQFFIDKYNASSTGNCLIRYGDLKKQLAEDMIKFLTPIRQKTNELLNNETLMKNIIKEGTYKARESSSKTLDIVKKAMQMWY
ncbi:MAG: tryptophan--tRNA ligase [Alphaproteobacteria bacterium]|nr:tryptophan--tRNA ligase [Alphaproteobacteria bacterium]